MKLIAIAALFGAAAAYCVYRIWQEDWVGAPWLWAVAVVCALISLAALLKDEDARVKHAQALRHEAGQGRMQEVETQQPQGAPNEHDTI